MEQFLKVKAFLVPNSDFIKKGKYKETSLDLQKQQANILKKSHKIDFENMVKAQGLKIYDKLSDVMPETGKELVKGQMVDVINGYGYIVGVFEVLGFCLPDEYGKCVYLDWDCYWFVKNPSDIIAK